ncbi:MAG: hypothetical protein AUH86_15320 [Acidobacteria bacterium 13_1_40CM_4_58_4]|nr:MAG: hypothetical protein AUH86_15320 [Acidobacteria bacterium 13_1_40CM_4_58_4]
MNARFAALRADSGNVTLLFVNKQDFQALCLAHPQVTLKVLRVVGALAAGRNHRELSFTTVRHRLASFLLRLVQPKAGAQRTAWK